MTATTQQVTGTALQVSKDEENNVYSGVEQKRQRAGSSPQPGSQGSPSFLPRVFVTNAVTSRTRTWVRKRNAVQHKTHQNGPETEKSPAEARAHTGRKAPLCFKISKTKRMIMKKRVPPLQDACLSTNDEPSNKMKQDAEQAENAEYIEAEEEEKRNKNEAHMEEIENSKKLLEFFKAP